MTESKEYLELTFRSINCFANDGKLDAHELGQLINIAERDGQFDQNEIRVLRNIISRIKPEEVDADMQEKLAYLSEKMKDQH